MMVDLDKVEFVEVGEDKEVWDLLLELLDVKEGDMICRYCERKIVPPKMGIMPPSNEKPILICDSVVCMVQYIGEFDKKGDES